MKKLLLKALRILVIVVVMSFVVSEIAIRVVGNTNADGQFFIYGKAMFPYVLPKQAVIEGINEYLDRQDEASTGYDPLLGWSPIPDYESESSGVTINNLGLRSQTDYTVEPQDDILRIAVFGDSFTYGAEIRDEETWVYQLEANLRERGLQVEVMNFGVGGYATDQIYLRWREFGRDFQPDWVIFGFLSDDIVRNQTIVRAILTPQTGIPFTKPRFVLTDGELELINSPTIPPEELREVMLDYENHPLFAYETRYDERYEQQWWHASKLLATLSFAQRLQEQWATEPWNDEIRDDALDLTMAIVERFSDEVMAGDTLFSMAYLPTNFGLTEHLIGNLPYYWSRLQPLAEQYPVFWVQEAFTDNRAEYWEPNAHYSPLASEIIADYLADDMVSCIADGRCTFDRFDSPAEFGFNVDTYGA